MIRDFDVWDSLVFTSKKTASGVLQSIEKDVSVDKDAAIWYKSKGYKTAAIGNGDQVIDVIGSAGKQAIVLDGFTFKAATQAFVGSIQEAETAGYKGSITDKRKALDDQREKMRASLAPGASQLVETTFTDPLTQKVYTYKQQWLKLAEGKDIGDKKIINDYYQGIDSNKNVLTLGEAIKALTTAWASENKNHYLMDSKDVASPDSGNGQFTVNRLYHRLFSAETYNDLVTRGFALDQTFFNQNEDYFQKVAQPLI
jgi:hypothetical protein